jgi:hypothetical protein
VSGESFDGASIEVLNWDRFNPRTDSKKPSWFRLENSIATGSSFFGLDCEQKWLWIFILSLTSQSNGEEIRWNAAYVQAHTGIKPSKQFETLEMFEKLDRLRVTRTELARDSHVELQVTTEHSPATRRDETRRDELNLAHPRKRESLDFESIYRKYPRKLGKAEGIKKAQREVTTPEAFAQLSGAVDRFVADLRRRGTEEKFIPYFSTFMSSWRDWLDPLAGTASVNSAGIVKAVQSPEADEFDRQMREAQAKLEAVRNL